MNGALAELAAYFRRWCELPNAELVRLAAAARAAGSRWEAIAAACDERDDPDAATVVYRPFGLIPGQGAGQLFRVTQHAVHELTGSGSGYFLPLTWPCPGGCDQPAAGCEVHHLRHQAHGGPTSVTGCALFCTFHHQVVIHQWGWTVVLNPDGTTTAWNKDKTKVIHSHSPPARPG